MGGAIFRLAIRVAGAFSAGLAKATFRWLVIAAVAGFVFHFHNELTHLILSILGVLWWIVTGLLTLVGALLSWLVSLGGKLIERRSQICKPGYVLDVSKCLMSCGAGYELDAAAHECVPICGAGSMLDKAARQCIPKCGSDYRLDAATLQCVSTLPGSRVLLRRMEGTTPRTKVALYAADFSASCVWRHNQKEVVDCESVTPGAVPLQFADLLKTATSALSEANTLVLVGTASREGDLRAQEAIAMERARQLARWIAERTDYSGNLILMNLGQFTAPECARCDEIDTGWQRPIIIIGVVEKLADAELKQAILSRLEGSVPSLPNRAHYSILDPSLVPFPR